MAPKIELAQAVTSVDVPAPAAPEAAGRSGDAGAPRSARRRVLARDPGLRRDRRGRVPRSQMAGQALDHQHPQAAGDVVGAGLRVVRRRRPARVRARPDVGARLPLSPFADRLDEPLRGSAADAVHPARLAAPARSPAPRPRLLARARRHAGPRPHPPLRRQGALPRPRHLPGLLPLLYAQLRGRHRHRGGGEVPAQGERRALGANLRLHPLAPRAGGHRHLGRRRLPAAPRADHPDRRDAAQRSTTSAGCATRPRASR